MSEPELHILRERLTTGVSVTRPSAAPCAAACPSASSGGRRRAREVRFHSDEAVTSAIRAVFARFAELGSARQVWL